MESLWGRRVLALLAGAAMGLGQEPFNLPLFIFLAVPLLFHLLRFETRALGRFGLGWCAGLGYFAVTLHWIVEPFLVYPEQHGWMAPFALLLKAGGHGLFWGAAFAATGPGLTLLAFAGAWTLAEYARATVLTGFPWALTGYAWVEAPIAQVASQIGPHALGFVTIFLAALPALFARRWIGATLAFAGVAALWVWGAERQTGGPLTVSLDKVVTVRLIQPNAIQSEKWKQEMIPVFFNRMIEFTAAPGDVDAVIWPEAAVPYAIDQAQEANARIASAKPEAVVMLGGRRFVETEGGREFYNSMTALALDGSMLTLYDKHHLVPFGEYLPFPAFWETFGLRALAQNAGRFARGPGPLVLTVPGLPPFQPLICYEMIFPHEMAGGNGPEGRPDWLVHLTNDAWFGNFSGPYQHLAQARMRAIEQGLPVARSANTGVSAMIDPYGAIIAEIGLNEAGYVDAVLPAPLDPTPYAIRGDRPFIIGIALIFLVGLGFGALRRNVMPN